MKQVYIPVKVVALLEEAINHIPVVLLFDKLYNRVLPIWIGEPEARAIIVSLHKIPIPRPLTHQLLSNIIKKLEAQAEKVVVTKIENGTYHATIQLKSTSKSISIDARPSDAIAFALETNTPLFVSEEVMNQGAQKNPLPSDITEEMILGKSAQHNPDRNSLKNQPKTLNLSDTDLNNLKKVLTDARKREQELS